VALPTGKNPGNHEIGGCMGARAGPDILEKRKISWPCQDLDHSATA